MATPDWEAIESAYRAGVLVLRDIGEQYGVTEGAIRKRAKKLGWVRKPVRKKERCVPPRSSSALAVRKKVRIAQFAKALRK